MMRGSGCITDARQITDTCGLPTDGIWGSDMQYKFDDEPEPCVDCPFYDECKRNHLACHKFAKYAISQRAGQYYKSGITKRIKYGATITNRPTAAVYDLIFCGTEYPSKDLVTAAILSVVEV